MDLLGAADPGMIPAEAITGLAFGIIKILAFGALAVVLAGFIASFLCDLFECRGLKRARGRTETWQLMH